MYDRDVMTLQVRTVNQHFFRLFLSSWAFSLHFMQYFARTMYSKCLYGSMDIFAAIYFTKFYFVRKSLKKSLTKIIWFTVSHLVLASDPLSAIVTVSFLFVRRLVKIWD